MSEKNKLEDNIWSEYLLNSYNHMRNSINTIENKLIDYFVDVKLLTDNNNEKQEESNLKD